MVQAEQPGSGRARSGGFGRLMTALAAGVAGGLIAPLIYPMVARGARPMAKRAVKAGIAAFEQGRVAAAELSEHASDLLAEARAEYDDEHKTGAGQANQTAASEVVTLRGAGREAAGS